MLKIKPGVDLGGLRPEMVVALIAADGIYASTNTELVVTSAKDSKHGFGSLHYVGLAVDIRTSNLTSSTVTVVHAELKASLGAQYDVILEKDHIHIEHQPKGPA